MRNSIYSQSRSYEVSESLSKQKMITALIVIALLFAILFPLGLMAQQREVYNKYASENAVYKDIVSNLSGGSVKVKVDVDQHGNDQRSQYDLAVDGAFEGQTVAVLQFYTGEGFDFELPKAALKQKGEYGKELS
jgi:hypothetical protein